MTIEQNPQGSLCVIIGPWALFVGERLDCAFWVCRGRFAADVVIGVA